MEGLTKPTVWVFPRLAVCLDCGAALFRVAEAELEQLADAGGQSYKAAVLRAARADAIAGTSSEAAFDFIR